MCYIKNTFKIMKIIILIYFLNKNYFKDQSIIKKLLEDRHYTIL
jgi:hypothetical protein